MPVAFWLWLVIDSLTLKVVAEVVVALGSTVEPSASVSADCLVVDLLVAVGPSCLSYCQASSAVGLTIFVARSQNSSSATMQRYFALLYLC